MQDGRAQSSVAGRFAEIETGATGSRRREVVGSRRFPQTEIGGQAVVEDFVKVFRRQQKGHLGQGNVDLSETVLGS